jgi:Tfp pilus assembly protein PilV
MKIAAAWKKAGRRPRGTRPSREERAFSLLEVMIALALFFMCVFAILSLVSRSLQQARQLEPLHLDARTAIAMLSLTNRLEEGPLPPEIIAQYELSHPDSTIMGDIYEVATNGLFRVDFVVGTAGGNKKAVTASSSVLLFRPNSQTRRFGNTGLRR